MSWKKFREYFSHNRIDENHFVLGIDMGNSMSAIAYFDPIRKDAEMLDISGGYGKAAAPTAIQHVAETGEWIFGEYAIFNANATDVLLRDFVAKLGSGEYFDTRRGLKSVTEICAIYLKELVANCRSINPKAQIAAVIATVPDFVGAAAKQALATAFARAGYEGALIDIVEEREACLQYFLHNEARPFKGNAMLLDFGGRGIRGGVYSIDGGNADCLCAAMDARLSMQALDDDAYKLFARYYCENFKIDIDRIGEAAAVQLLTFAFQHKDMLFQQGASPIRLYYNFPYPPFSRQVTPDEAAGIVGPAQGLLKDFIRDLIDKVPGGVVNAVICTGGGFEMPWAKKLASQMFDEGVFRSYKSAKGILAEGASLMAAGRLGLLPGLASLKIADSHKIPWDIGIKVAGVKGKTLFYPIVERGSWLRQKSNTVYVILQDEDSEIGLYKRDESGELMQVGAAVIKGLPQRPVGTSKLAISVRPDSIDEYIVNIRDVGFGELFPIGPDALNENFLVRICT